LDAEVAPANSVGLRPDDEGEPKCDVEVEPAAKSVALSGDKPHDSGEPRREVSDVEAEPANSVAFRGDKLNAFEDGAGDLDLNSSPDALAE
jgi:hypothetical protein